eukprot:scaffold34606_cov81-Skeletonema_dohrnii-CCMP3373.AAC.1
MSESNSNTNSGPMSSENSTSTDTNTKRGQDQGKQRDTMHLTTALCFVTSTTFWLVCLFRYHPNAWYVFQNAFAILAVCFVADNTVACLAPSLKRRQVVMHYFMGLLQNLLYILLFVASPSLFEKVWTSIFFGWYLFTWIIILTQKAEFFFMFRLFYTIHHASAFFVTGSWMIVSPCCFLDDNVFIYRGIVIWLSAEIYNVGLNTFRGIRPKTDKNMLRRMKTAVFVMERIHRSIAYFQPPTVPATQHNTLMWVVFGTGLWNDIIDISFQLQSLCKHYREAKQQSEEKRRGSHLEVEVAVEDKEEVMTCNATSETDSDIELDV